MTDTTKTEKHAIEGGTEAVEEILKFMAEREQEQETEGDDDE